MGCSVVADPRERQRPFWFVEKDGGFTSAGVVVALALTIALLFTTAQVYWVNSTAGDIQFAADAGALAAENVVAEYYVVARISDAVVLSLSLFGLVVFGIAIVLSCIPFTQELGVTLMDFGENVFKVRNDIAREAKQALIRLQKALPFLAVLNAYSVISANSFSPSGEARYLGIAILVPLEGDEVEFADDSVAADSADELREQNAETGALTDDAENARKGMDQAKLEGYMADCGAEPNYCMYERAKRLASLSGAQNPNFSSVELWEFDYALDRARAYYRARLANEAPANSKLDDQIRSFVRRQFYSYAIEELQKGYAYTDADGVFQGYFPLLAHNSSEIRSTRLYTDRMFPIDSSGNMHGVATCSRIEGVITNYGSIADLEAGSYVSCPECDLGIETIGKVASATTSTESGFEHYYRIVADAAERYKKATKEYRGLTGNAEDSVGGALDSYAEALKALSSPRFDPKPPGRNGCIVLVFDLSTHVVPGAFTSSFVSNTFSLPPRMAISAAALAKDEASEGDTILSSFLDRTLSQMDDSTLWGFSLGIFDSVLSVWGDVLLVYSRGADSMAKGLGDFLRSIPIINATPLASWAQRALQETIEMFGLQGVDLSAPKPVVVNSIHVINAGDSEALKMVSRAKWSYSASSGSGSGTLVSGVMDALIVEAEQWGSGFLESEFTIYTISFGDIPGAPQIPIKVKLPPAVVERGRSLLSDGLEWVGSLFEGGSSVSVWE